MSVLESMDRNVCNGSELGDLEVDSIHLLFQCMGKEVVLRIFLGGNSHF